MSQGESKLSRDIMAALRAHGAFVWKNHGGPTMMSGLPDIVGSYRGMFIGVETKMPEGSQPTPIQRLRHAEIRTAGGHVTVARTVREAVEWLAGVPVSQPTPKTSVRPSGAWECTDDCPSDPHMHKPNGSWDFW